MAANRFQIGWTARCDINAVDYNAARVRFDETEHLFQQSCLSGSASAEKDEDFGEIIRKVDAQLYGLF